MSRQWQGEEYYFNLDDNSREWQGPLQYINEEATVATGGVVRVLAGMGGLAADGGLAGKRGGLAG